MEKKSVRLKKGRERKKQIGKKGEQGGKGRKREAKSKLHSTSWKRRNREKKTAQDEQYLKTRDREGWIFGEEKPESEGWGQREI